MGACVSNNGSKISKQNSSYDLEKIPDDIEMYNPQHNNNLQVLKFQGSLSNVRLQGDIKEEYGILFQIPQKIFKASFPPLQPVLYQKHVIKWKIKQPTFKISANEYQIRKKALQIKIIKKNEQVYESFKINFYQILTGPINNNFKIKSEEVQVLRFFKYKGEVIHLIFDLRISQVLKSEIKIRSVDIKLQNQFPGERFNFTFELGLSENGKNYRKMSSRPSNSFEIPSNQENLQSQLIDNPSELINLQNQQEKSNKKCLGKKCVKKQYSTLNWNNSTVEQNYLPEIIFNLNAEEINSSIFMFHFWKVNDKKDTNQKEVMHRFANFRLTLLELFEKREEKIRKFSVDGIMNPSIQTKLEVKQELWLNGAMLGFCKCEIQIKITKYLKQLLGWTRTQKGPMTMLMEELGTDGDSVYLKSFSVIQNLHDKLLEIKLKLAQNSYSFFRRKQIYPQALKIIQQISKHLKLIDLQSHIHYNIQKLKQLNQKQWALLQILKTISSFLRDQNQQFVDQCWGLIIFLIKRGEFQLKNIGFNKQESKQIQQFFFTKQKLYQRAQCPHKNKQKYHKLLKNKIKIALQFQKLLFQCLNISLNTIPYENNEGQSKLQNCQIFKGYCYIRIPLFRQYILNSILQQDDIDYSQFQIKERQWLKSKVEIKQKQIQIVKQLQWNEYFYKNLEYCSQSKDLENQLKETLQNCIWIEEISKRQHVFFEFIRVIMLKFQHIQNRLKIPNYKYFSGYNKLICAFLNEMRNYSLKNYPISMIKASMVLLNNQELYQPVLLIIAKKTNYYDPSLVVKCISIYKSYINYLTQDKKTLPLSFCYGIFMKMIKKLLQNDAVYCVSAILLMIYQCYDKFEFEFQSYLSVYFLGNKFIPLFYHWSYVVRSIFYYFLILKIAQNKRMFYNEEAKCYTRFYSTYKNVLNELEQTKRASFHAQAMKVTQMEQQKSYYLKLKHKIWKNKNKDKSPQDFFLNIQTSAQKRTVSEQHFQDGYSSNRPSDNQHFKPLQIFDFQKFQQLSKLNLKKKESMAFIRAGTILDESEQDLPPELNNISLTSKKYTYHQSAKYHGAFRQQQFHLPELTQIQKNQIYVAHLEFQKINHQIKQRYLQTYKLPYIPLNNQVAMDSSDIKLQDLGFSTF